MLTVFQRATSVPDKRECATERRNCGCPEGTILSKVVWMDLRDWIAFE